MAAYCWDFFFLNFFNVSTLDTQQTRTFIEALIIALFSIISFIIYRNTDRTFVTFLSVILCVHLYSIFFGRLFASSRAIGPRRVSPPLSLSILFK